MPDDLYILAATAVKKTGLSLERRIILEYVMAQSREDAIRKGVQRILEQRLPPDLWGVPILKAEGIPTPRIARYRDELKIRDNSLTRLTFLWGYAIFYHESSSLQCATIIAQTKRIAEENVLSGPGKYTRGRKDFSLEKIPSRLIIPRPPGHEDPAEIFRNRFSDIIKK